MPDEREYQSVVGEAEQAVRAGDFVLADRHLRDALVLQEASLGTTHPRLASTLNNLAVVCETLGQFDDAERFYRRAYAIASGALPPGDPLVATSRDNLQDFCTARGLPFEDWPGIGQPAPPRPVPLPPPVDDPPPTRQHTPPPADVPPERRAPRPAAPATSAPAPRHVDPPAGTWSMRAIGAVLVLAAIGALVVVTSWRNAAPSASPPVTPVAPSAAPPPPAAVDAPAAAAPVAIAPPVAPATRPPSAVPPSADPPATPPATPPAPTGALPPSPAGAPPTDVRIVVADVCRALSTSGVWRCEPLGDTAAPGRATFYTRLASPRPLRVEHRWYQGEALRQRVTLSIGASPSAGYRTFSRQTLTRGAWRVELRAADGALLHEAAFDIR